MERHPLTVTPRRPGLPAPVEGGLSPASGSGFISERLSSASSASAARVIFSIRFEAPGRVVELRVGGECAAGGHCEGARDLCAFEQMYSEIRPG
jgi:hypothetical protein